MTVIRRLRAACRGKITPALTVAEMLRLATAKSDDQDRGGERVEQVRLADRNVVVSGF